LNILLLSLVACGNVDSIIPTSNWLWTLTSRWAFQKWKSSAPASIPFSYSATSFFLLGIVGKRKQNARLLFTLGKACG
jgi:hypothetical protein